MMKEIIPHTYAIPNAVKKRNPAMAASPAIKMGRLPKLAMIKIAKRAETPLAAPIT